MNYQIVVLALILAGCSIASPIKIDDAYLDKIQRPKPNYALAVFGGALLGYDEGEWGGSLQFANRDGVVTTLINDNVHGIYSTDAGVLAFVGLSHMARDDGAIYKVDVQSNHGVVASKIIDLPGAPRFVSQRNDGTLTFELFSEKVCGDIFCENIYKCYLFDPKKPTRVEKCPS